ncbi:hypothetical protein GQX74_009427 [Glossina fuscipes]|nr:hypothetical protein GQX74_009427 [Glossina fuscipes]
MGDGHLTPASYKLVTIFRALRGRKVIKRFRFINDSVVTMQAHPCVELRQYHVLLRKGGYGLGISFVVAVGRWLVLLKRGGIVMFLQIQLKSRYSLCRSDSSTGKSGGVAFNIPGRLGFSVANAKSINGMTDNLIVEIEPSEGKLLVGIVYLPRGDVYFLEQAFSDILIKCYCRGVDIRALRSRIAPCDFNGKYNTQHVDDQINILNWNLDLIHEFMSRLGRKASANCEFWFN